uniref:Uncharacterized protein n=1 Tax=Ascaris lumbricoides TaxID=6252 RepID=A0A0M3I3Q8_ASCLU
MSLFIQHFKRKRRTFDVALIGYGTARNEEIHCLPIITSQYSFLDSPLSLLFSVSTKIITSQTHQSILLWSAKVLGIIDSLKRIRKLHNSGILRLMKGE